MSDLESIFQRLGLEQYLEDFVAEGFDTWDTVKYITESDLDALNVKLGHRRKLQKEIAQARGISFDQLVPGGVRSFAGEGPPGDQHPQGSTSADSGSAVPGQVQKRKYRRHPKVDENAPVRPPSAYVIFSNKIRLEIKDEKLSFPEIAKLVGEKWQGLPPEGKEPFETEAGTLKEKYNTELARYKRTSQYREYQQYLNDFKAKNASQYAGKRPKLEPRESGGAGSISSNTSLSTPHDISRQESYSNLAHSPSGSGLSSPAGSYSHGRAISPSESLSSTVSSTPVNPSFNRLSISSPAAQNPRQQQPAHQPLPLQPLPRMISPESREPTSNAPTLQSILTDPSAPGRPSAARRPVVSSTPAFVRHDTSKSSVSSTVSTGSASSSAVTPITPLEDSKQGRMTPYTPIGSASLNPIQEQVGSFVAPPPPQATPMFSKPMNAQNNPYFTQSPASSSPSLSDSARALDRSRPHSNPQDATYGGAMYSPPIRASRSGPIPSNNPMSRPLPQRAHPHHQQQGPSPPPLIQPQQTPPPAPSTSEGGRMDALSVLALAGKMVDDDQRRPPE